MKLRLRKALSLVISLAMVLTMCTGFTSVSFAQDSNPSQQSDVKAAENADLEKCTDEGNGTASSPYIISSKAQMLDLKEQVNSGSSFEGKYFELKNDIDLSDHADFIVGTSSKQFKGNFNGKDKKVTLNVDARTSNNVALFGYAYNATIENVVVAGMIAGKYGVGAIVGYNNGSTVKNCVNEAAIYTDTGSTGTLGSGGIVGAMTGDDAAIINCTNKGDINPLFTSTTGISYTSYGGIVGVVFNYAKNAVISGCKNEGALKDIPSITVGGIVGKIYNAEATVEDCVNSGAVSAVGTSSNSTNGTGGIVGYYSGYKTETIVTRCSNTGAVTGREANNAATGGIVGKSGSGYVVEESFNVGAVTAGASVVGGVVGHAAGNVAACYNTGAVSNTKASPTSSYPAYAGGVVGWQSTKSVAVKNCYSAGEVSGAATNAYGYFGAVIGKLYSTSVDSSYVANNKYLASSAKLGIGNINPDNEVCTSFEKSEASGILETLGKAYQADLSTPINGGYPILRWQNPEAKFGANFSVSDKETKTALRDAKVEIEGQIVQADGSFELAPGEYTYKVSRDGYASVSDTFTIKKKSRSFDIELTSVKHDYVVKVKPSDADLTISNENGAPAVAVPTKDVDKDTGYATYTYVLADKAAYGAYNLSYSCYMYKKGTVQLEATGTDDAKTIDMVALEKNAFTMNVNPADAKVYITNTEYNQQATATSSENGTWKFDLVPGEYSYKVKASGYNTEEGTFTVPADSSKSVTLELKPMWDGKSYDTDWYIWHPLADTYEISEPEELAGLAKLVNEGKDFSGKTINLVKDLDLGGNAADGKNSWTSIGNNSKTFKGAFNGNGHVIKNLYISITGTAAVAHGYRGLFGNVDGAKISNFSFENAVLDTKTTSSGYNLVGILAGKASKTDISNITVNGKITLPAASAYTGGIVGQFDGTISDCVNNADIKAGYQVGGIIGATYTNDGSKIIRCVNNGDISGYRTGTTKSYATGGIAGHLYRANDCVKYCVNYGKVSGVSQSMGGIVGCLAVSSRIQTVDSCYNLGSVESENTASYVGGIVGWVNVSYKPRIHDCYSAGELTGSNYRGGVFGAQDSATIDSTIIYNNYYLANDNYKASNTTSGTAIENEVFTPFEKSATNDYSELIENLGAAYAPDVKSGDTYVYSNGYPILRWQNPDSKFQVKFDISYDDKSNISDSEPLKIVITDEKGQAVYTGSSTKCELVNGTYAYTIEQKGYAQVSGSFVVDRDFVNEAINLNAEKYNYVVQIDSSVDFSLERVGEDSNTPIENPAYQESSDAQELGFYTFNLVNGTYAYTAKKIGYFKETGTFEVSYAAGSKSITLKAMESEKVRFSVTPEQGSFTGSDPAVSIYCKGGDFDGTLLKTYDATSQLSEGLYFPEGDYTYKIKADGFNTTDGEFSVAKGTPVHVEVQMPVKTGWGGAEDVDTDWYTDYPDATTYTLTNESQLAGLAKLVNDGTDTFAGKTVLLGKDMDLKDGAWTPIGGYAVSKLKGFSGTFDGQGHSIIFKNAQMNASEATFGVFGCLIDASVSNVVLQGNAKINYTEENASYMMAYAGGLAGYATRTSIKNCSNQMRFDINLTNESGTAMVNCGGIVGWAVGASFESCNNIAIIETNLTGKGVTTCSLGGIVGFNNSGQSSASSKTTNCYNTGEIKATATSSNDGSSTANVGGIFGMLSGSKTYFEMTNCYAASAVSAQAKTAKPGALIGSTGSGNFFNNYYLDNGLSEASAESEKRTDTQMRLIDFVRELGEAYALNNNGGYPILAWEKSVDHIKVTTLPTKTEYTDLEDFDESGMKITAYTSADDSEAYEVSSGWTVLNGKKLPFGQESVTIEYKGAQVELPITIKQGIHQISSSDLVFDIAAPKAGETPQKSIDLSAAQSEKYSASISWTKAGKDFDGAFEKASFYRAHVTLTAHYAKDDVYYVFDRGALPSIKDSLEIRNYKQANNEDNQRVVTEFDVTFKATSNASEAVSENLLHLYYDGEQGTGSQYAEMLDQTLTVKIGNTNKTISIRDLEQKVLEEGIGVQGEYGDGNYAGVYLYNLLIDMGLAQNTNDDTAIVFESSSNLPQVELTFGDIRQQQAEDGAIVAFSDASLNAPLAKGQGPLKMVQKDADAKSQQNLTGIVVDNPNVAATAKVSFVVNEDNPSITITDEFGRVMEADTDSALSYTLRDNAKYTYRVAKENYTVVTGSFELKGVDQEISITLDPVWDGKTLTKPQKDDEGYYLIGTAAELMWWHDNYEATDRVKLTADIALNDGETNNKNWDILGTNSGYSSSGSLAFAGILDGQGHVIKNLSIDRENTYELEVSWDGSVLAFPDRISEFGFFGYTAGNAEIKNLGIEGSITVFDRPDSSLADWLQIGGIVGLAQGNTKISNCYTNMAIKAVASLETETVGGYPVAGYGYACDDYIGGIAGSLSANSTITDCYTKGTYIGAETRQVSMGGIVGGLRYSTNSVTNCYSTASLETKTLAETQWNSYVGGIVGQGSYNGAVAPITNCYALNTSIKANGLRTTIGKVAGNAAAEALSSNFSLSDIRISGADLVSGEGETSLNGAAISADQAKAAATYAKWSSDSWNLQDGSYPMLKWQKYPAGADKTTSYTGQKVTEDGEWDGYFGSQTPPPYFNIYAKVKGHDSVIVKSFKRSEMEAMAQADNEGTLYYSAVGYGYAGRAVKEYVYLDTLFKNAGVEFKSGDNLGLGYYLYSYDGLMADRYYYPEWTNNSSEGAVKIKPALALKSFGASSGVTKELWNYYALQADYLYAYMLVYGQRTPSDVTYSYFMYQQTEGTVNYKTEVTANSTVKNILSGALADAQVLADNCYVSADGTDIPASYFFTDEATKNAFVEALNEAKATLNNNDATNDDVMTAYENVKAAEKKLNKVKKQGLGVDRTALQAKIDTANYILANIVASKDGFKVSENNIWATLDSIETLKAAVKTAQEVCDDEAVSQIELQQAEQDLTIALESFVSSKGLLETLERDAFVQELQDYVASLDMNSYRTQEQEQIQGLLKDYSRKIRDSKKDYIAYDVLKEAKAAISSVKTKTVVAQEEAKAELKSYVDLSTLSREDRAVIQDIIDEYSAQIDTASAEEIADIVTAAKAEIDLAYAKQKAIDELENNYSKADQFYDSEQNKLTNTILTNVHAIEKATSVDEVQQLLSAAQAAIDALQTKTVKDNTPATTSGVSTKSVSSQSVQISWKKGAKAKFYEVYRSDSANGTYVLVVTTTATSYTNASLVCGKTYYYKVRAYGMDNTTKLYGNYSSVVKAKPVPGKVTISKLKSTGKKKVKITWKKTSSVDGYQIYRATSKKGSYKKIKTVKVGKSTPQTKKVTVKSYTNKKLKQGKKYYYKVRAYKVVNGKKIYGSFSTIKSVKAK